MASQIKYCPDCCQNITLDTGINWLLFVILLLFGIFPAIFYWIVARRKQCPICGAGLERLERARIPKYEG